LGGRRVGGGGSQHGSQHQQNGGQVAALTHVRAPLDLAIFRLTKIESYLIMIVYDVSWLIVRN
jgi:hypothetical protein